MKKLILFVGLLCFGTLASHLRAQSINNRNWKAFFADPFNDTLTFHIRSDTSFVSNSKGEVLLHTNCKINADTLTLLDYGTGEYTCPDMTGQYKINLANNTFIL